MIDTPLLSHRVLYYKALTVGSEWVHRSKVDPHDKILFVIGGWARVRGPFGSETKERVIQPGEMLLVPSHVAVDYCGSPVLRKMHVYFELLHRNVPLSLAKLGACSVSSFSLEQLEECIRDDRQSRLIDDLQLNGLIAQSIGRLLRSSEAGLRMLVEQSDRYATLDRITEENPVFSLRVSDLAAALGIGTSTLSRRFRRDTGQTIKSYLKSRVIVQAKQLLAGPGAVKEIAHRLGFSDELYFSKYFKRETGFTPTAYRASLHREL